MGAQSGTKRDSKTMATEEFDVIVVGGGNAAFCAALSAQEQGARVVVLERAPEDECRRQYPLHRRRYPLRLSSASRT